MDIPGITCIIIDQRNSNKYEVKYVALEIPTGISSVDIPYGLFE